LKLFNTRVCVFIYINNFNNFFAAFLYCAYILIAIGVESCVPLFYELSCENTYPIAEGVTGGLLTWLNNVVGGIFLLILMFIDGNTFWFYIPFICKIV
jgi:hypothetical protein